MVFIMTCWDSFLQVALNNSIFAIVTVIALLIRLVVPFRLVFVIDHHVSENHGIIEVLFLEVIYSVV